MKKFVSAAPLTTALVASPAFAQDAGSMAIQAKRDADEPVNDEYSSGDKVHADEGGNVSYHHLAMKSRLSACGQK